MNWIILVVLTIIFESLQLFINNYTADTYFKKRGAVSQSIYLNTFAFVLAIIMLIATGFSISAADLPTICMIILSGILIVADGIPYMRALEIDDSTNVGIFIQLSPLLYLIIGWLFLNEPFSPYQLIPFLLILAAPFLVILTTRKKSKGIRIKAAFYAFLCVVISTLGNLIFARASNGDNFIQNMAFIFIGKFIGTMMIIFSRKKWRIRLKNVTKNSKGKIFRPISANFLVSTLKDFTYRGALITALTLAIASASTDTLEPLAIFFMGIILTLIWPKFGREKLDKKTVSIHFISIALIVTGIIMLNTLQ